MIERTILHIFNDGGKRVILPSFGALIKRESGEIAFTDMLTEDDGVLTAECIYLYDKSKEEVRHEIESFILSLHDSLVNNNKATIAGIGTIAKNPSGVYALSSEKTLEQEFSGADSIELDASPAIVEKAVEQEQSSAESDHEPYATESTDTDASTATAIFSDGNATTTDSPELTDTDASTATVVYDQKIDNNFSPEGHTDTEEHSTSVVFQNRSKKAILRSALYGSDSDAGVEVEKKAAVEEEIAALHHEIEEAVEAAEEYMADNNSEITKEDDRKLNNAVETAYITEAAIYAQPDTKTENTPAKPAVVTEIYSQGQGVARAEKPTEKPYTPEFNIRHPNTGKKRRVDGVMVIAIVALIIIIGVIVYGQFVEREVYNSQETPIILNMEDSVE